MAGNFAAMARLFSFYDRSTILTVLDIPVNPTETVARHVTGCHRSRLTRPAEPREHALYEPAGEHVHYSPRPSWRTFRPIRIM